MLWVVNNNKQLLIPQIKKTNKNLFLWLVRRILSEILEQNVFICSLVYVRMECRRNANLRTIYICVAVDGRGCLYFGPWPSSRTFLSSLPALADFSEYVRWSYVVKYHYTVKSKSYRIQMWIGWPNQRIWLDTGICRD